MLKKLFVYDYRSAGAWLLPLLIAPIPLGIVSGLLYWLLSVVSNIALSIFCGAFLFISVLGTYLCAPTLYIWLIVRFYKSVFTDEGYLTMVLPTKSQTLLLSKILFTACFSIAGIVSMLIGMFTFFGILAVNDIGLVMAELPEIYQSLLSVIGGGNMVMLGVEAFFYLIVSTLSSILLVFLSVTAGSLVFKRHRFIGFLLFYFAFSSVIGGIGSGSYAVIFGLLTPLLDGIGSAFPLHLFIWLVVLLIGGVCVGLFYLVNYLISHKLNLA